jgi:hypothetical protein
MYVVVEPNTIPVQQTVQYNKIINIKDVKQEVELELRSKKIIETILTEMTETTETIENEANILQAIQ